jgi:heme-binding protein
MFRTFRMFPRTAAAVAAAAAVGAGTVLLTGPTAPVGSAAPDPCSASQVAKTAGSVATNTGTYLEKHPQTNQALTMIAKQQSGPQSVAAVKSYFDANPMVAADLQRLQQPLASLGSQCELPVTLPQLLGLVQAAQSAAPAQPAPAVPATPPAQAAGATPGFLTNG